MPYPFDVAKPVQRLRVQEILDQIAPRLVDVRIDHVGRDGRRLQGELDPDVAADLPDVDLLPRKRIGLSQKRAWLRSWMLARVFCAAISWGRP